MITVRCGKYKLAKQTGRTAHFAQVAVKIQPSTFDQFTISAPADSIRGWNTPALAGAEAAISELRGRGWVQEPQLVTITDFIGLMTDTNDADANWATFMAVFSAFPEVQQPILEFSPDRNIWVRS